MGPLNYPEGVCVTREGSLLVTTSSAEEAVLPFFRVTVTGIGDDGEPTTLYESIGTASLSEVVCVGDDSLLLANEAAGIHPVPAPPVLLLLPGGAVEPMAEGLTACEGLGAHPLTVFPVLVTEEGGSVHLLHRSGELETLLTGAGSVEDAEWSPDGRVFVSEDATGRILVLSREASRR